MSKIVRVLVCGLFLAGFALAQEAKTDADVPSGPALTEGEVVVLLQAKVPLDTIQQFVAARGVNFISTKDSSKRIIAAGGNVALIGTINLNQKEEAAAEVQDNGKKKK
jgi:hypothetical protein